MRYLVFAILSLGIAVSAFGQRQAPPYYSLGGYGNVLYPGTGHAPTAPPAGYVNPARVGHPGGGVITARPPVNHQQHARTVIVPYPIYYGNYGGYGYGYEAPAAPAEYQGNYQDQGMNPGVPPVVINQTFVPPQASPMVREYDQPQEQQSGMKLYQAPPSHPYADVQEAAPAPLARRVAGSDQATIYLIAFKDHNIVQALGYWMEGANLHYVSVEHSLNQASLDLIDRDLSQRLNSERGLEFKLPAAK